MLRNLLSNINSPCYEHLCAYKHGLYKNRSPETIIAELHLILSNVVETVSVAKRIVDEIPKI